MTREQFEKSASAHDTDKDGFNNLVDVCPAIADPDQKDTDKDGLGDACDRCPTTFSKLIDGCPLPKGVDPDSADSVQHDPTYPATPPKRDARSETPRTAPTPKKPAESPASSPAKSEVARPAHTANSKVVDGNEEERSRSVEETAQKRVKAVEKSPALTTPPKANSKCATVGSPIGFASLLLIGIFVARVRRRT